MGRISLPSKLDINDGIQNKGAQQVPHFTSEDNYLEDMFSRGVIRKSFMCIVCLCFSLLIYEKQTE